MAQLPTRRHPAAVRSASPGDASGARRKKPSLCPLLDIAMRLEETALKDPYFTEGVCGGRSAWLRAGWGVVALGSLS